MDCPWRYDESVQVGTDYGDREEVRAYDQRMAKLCDGTAEAAAIREALRLTRTSTVWEIGAGTEACAIALAAGVHHVYATDVSPAMLDYARDQAARQSLSNITFAMGGFLSGFHPDAPVDGVVSQLALHHLPDFWKARALDIIARHLRPNGRLFLRDAVFPSDVADYDDYFQTAIENVRTKGGDEAAAQTVAHIRTEYSTLDWILEGMIARAGLTIVEAHHEGFLSVYICEK